MGPFLALSVLIGFGEGRVKQTGQKIRKKIASPFFFYSL